MAPWRHKPSGLLTHLPKGSITILRATEADSELALIAVREIHRRSPVDQAALYRFLRDPDSYLLLAIVREQVVGSLNGCAVLRPDRPDVQFLLYEIDVRPEWRNRGIGATLVNRFIDEGRAAGASEVWVLTNESNAAAMAMYSHCGLRRQNKDDVMLSLKLKLAADQPS